jgi:hypothetical protein
MRRVPAIALILLVALAGCGESDHEQVNPELMLDQASARSIPSANLDVDARVQVVGIERLSEPIKLRLEGPYVSGEAVRIPSFDWRASASALGFPVGGRLVSTGENVYLSIYGESYEVGGPAVATANRRIGESAAAGRLDLDPRAWLGRARVVGDDNAGGADCERIAAPLRSDAVTRDLAPFVEELGLPEALAFSGRVTACVGYDDRLLHELEVHAAVGIPAADRSSLGGATGVLLDATVEISDAGEEEEEISAPRGPHKPIRDLLLTLSDLGVPVPL